MRHGLALSGGGAKGAFEAGAAAAIVEHYRFTESPITILSGTSVGALNAAGIAAKGARYPIELWHSISTARVYRKPFYSLPWRLWRQSAVYDSSPLWTLIQENVNPDFLVRSTFRLFVHTTDLEMKQPVIFTGGHPDILRAIWASASVPGAFPPVRWRGRWLVDGGTVDNSPIRSLIRAGCELITIVHLDETMPARAVFASSLAEIPSSSRPGIAAVLGNSIEAMMDAHFQRDLRNVQLINRLVDAGVAPRPDHRKVQVQLFGPDYDLGDPLDFDTDRARRNLDRGFHQALIWLRDLES